MTEAILRYIKLLNKCKLVKFLTKIYEITSYYLKLLFKYIFYDTREQVTLKKQWIFIHTYVQ